MPVNFLDLSIFLFVVFLVWRGTRTGFLAGALSLVGVILGATLGSRIVPAILEGENDLVFGSVNANRRHYEAAAEALADADNDWLGRLITRRVALESWHEALTREPDDIKVVVELGG